MRQRCVCFFLKSGLNPCCHDGALQMNPGNWVGLNLFVVHGPSLQPFSASLGSFYGPAHLEAVATASVSGAGRDIRCGRLPSQSMFAVIRNVPAPNVVVSCALRFNYSIIPQAGEKLCAQLQTCLEQPDAKAVREISDWAWSFLGPTSMQGDYMKLALSHVIRGLAPVDKKFGTGGTCRAQLPMILLVVMSTHEIKTIFQQKQVPRWTWRVLRLMDPLRLKILETDEHIFKSRCMSWVWSEGGRLCTF